MATAQKKRTSTAKSSSTRKQPARKPAARRSSPEGPPSLTAAHVKGFAAGTLAGVLIGAGGITYLTKTAMQQPAVVAETVETPAEAEKAAPKPRFDFFTVLPNQELDLASDVEPAAVAAANNKSDLYVLQAGSFRQQSDADQRRAELTLLGMEATIEETRGENGVWYRVYLGPFESRSKMAQARSMAAQQSIDTLLLRRPREP